MVVWRGSTVLYTWACYAHYDWSVKLTNLCTCTIFTPRYFRVHSSLALKVRVRNDREVSRGLARHYRWRAVKIYPVISVLLKKKFYWRLQSSIIFWSVSNPGFFHGIFQRWWWQLRRIYKLRRICYSNRRMRCNGERRLRGILQHRGKQVSSFSVKNKIPRLQLESSEVS